MTDLPEGIVRTPEGFYVVRDDSQLSRWVEQHRRLDLAADEIALVSKYIPSGGVVVDCGACIGDHTASYSRLVGSAGLVFAFEPHPMSFQALVLNSKECMPDNVVCINAALGEDDTEMAFDREPNIGASHVHAVAQGPEPTERVNVQKLDGYLEAMDRLDFIHLDAEGFEPFIIAGAAIILRKFRPVMLIEFNIPCLERYGFTEAQFRTLLTGLGYRLEEFNGTPASIMRDVLCIPE